MTDDRRLVAVADEWSCGSACIGLGNYVLTLLIGDGFVLCVDRAGGVVQPDGRPHWWNESLSATL